MENKPKFKIGLLCSSFDLMHIGHLRTLEVASEQCEKIIVCLNVVPENGWKNKPVQSVYERYKKLSMCKNISKIIPYESEEDLLLLLQTTTYDVRILGEDYLGREWTGIGYEACMGIKTLYIDRSHGKSSTELKNRVKING